LTKVELERKLKRAGWVIIHGKAHDQATNPSMLGVKIPIPRHAVDIPTGTAKAILKEAGIE
jgi:predicted RNA binding protein YcfA (HicA-like mRNA interferase family)